MKSKIIDDFFEAEFESLKPDTSNPFEIYLYFPQSTHLILWKHTGESITADFLDRYKNKGCAKIWIHNDDRDAYLSYLNPPEEHIPEEPIPEEIEEEPFEDAPIDEEGMRTYEGAFLNEVLDSDELTDEQKEFLASEVSGKMITEMTEATTEKQQERVNEKAKAMVEDVIADTINETQPAIQEIWKMANVDPELEHAVNVATYSVIFAMAFGRIDKELLLELAQAGLLHDVGISQVSANITHVPLATMTEKQKLSYAGHVESGIRMIEKHADTTPPRVLEVIRQHHEKYDGSGFPAKLKENDFDDLAQLVAMADMIESLTSGQWDGKKRLMKDSFSTLEALQNDPDQPDFFNPDVLEYVTKWVKSEEGDASIKDAIGVVEEQVKDIMN